MGVVGGNGEGGGWGAVRKAWLDRRRRAHMNRCEGVTMGWDLMGERGGGGGGGNLACQLHGDKRRRQRVRLDHFNV